MASIADINLHFWSRAAGDKGLTTTAGNGCFLVIRVDISLHDSLLAGRVRGLKSFENVSFIRSNDLSHVNLLRKSVAEWKNISRRPTFSQWQTVNSIGADSPKIDSKPEKSSTCLA